MLAAVVALWATGANAQQANLIYRLGKDTVAAEQWTRTPTRIIGEMFARNGAAINRIQYDIAVGPDGRF